MVEDPFEVLRKNRELLRLQAFEMKREGLLEMLPQGHGSGLDADTVDGLHAVELIARAPGKGGGGGGSSGESMVKHGNEWHNVPFAQKSCQVCMVDELPGDDAVGHAVLLREGGACTFAPRVLARRLVAAAFLNAFRLCRRMETLGRPFFWFQTVTRT